MTADFDEPVVRGASIEPDMSAVTLTLDAKPTPLTLRFPPAYLIQLAAQVGRIAKALQASIGKSGFGYPVSATQAQRAEALASSPTGQVHIRFSASLPLDQFSVSPQIARTLAKELLIAADQAETTPTKN